MTTEDFAIEQYGDHWRVYTNGWGMGIKFPTERAAKHVIKAIVAEFENEAAKDYKFPTAMA